MRESQDQQVEKYYWVNENKAKVRVLWGYLITEQGGKPMPPQDHYMSHWLFFASQEDAEKFVKAHVDTEYLITEDLKKRRFDEKTEA